MLPPGFVRKLPKLARRICDRGVPFAIGLNLRQHNFGNGVLLRLWKNFGPGHCLFESLRHYIHPIKPIWNLHIWGKSRQLQACCDAVRQTPINDSRPARNSSPKPAQFKVAQTPLRH